MAVLLPLCSAATYGVGDFMGGMATRQAAASAVLFWSHRVGVLLLLAVWPWTAARSPGTTSLAIREGLLGVAVVAAVLISI